jgi:hypothetical protein
MISPIALTVRPGYCADHPNQRLVTHRSFGIRRYGAVVETVCPHPDHELEDRERCRWCGGPLIAPGTPPWQVSDRRVYCTDNHRLQAFRARKVKP